MKTKLVVALCAAVVLAGCKAVPVDLNHGELVASEGVRKIFEEENVDAVEAGERVRCERRRRTGTHMVQRLCMTIDEWDEHYRRIREVAYNRLNQPCIPSQIAAPAEPGLAGGRTADSGCGFGSVD